VTDSIGPAELESIFDVWEQRFSRCIQMKDKYVAEDKSKSFGENPYSHHQNEMPKKQPEALDQVPSSPMGETARSEKL
jgi:hypothetical protein